MATYDQAATATWPTLERVPGAGLPHGIGAGRCPFAGHAVATPDSGLDVKVTSPADLWRDQPIIDAIDRWWAGDAPDSLTLAKLISGHIRALGKHVLSVPILTRLTEIRRQHGARDPFLDAFLDGVLDKFEGRYYNRTYLALPLLERICDDPRSGLDPERMSALLMADVVRFESRGGRRGVHQRPAGPCDVAQARHPRSAFRGELARRRWQRRRSRSGPR